MSPIDFLKDILPEGTRYSIRFIKKGGFVSNRMLDTLGDETQQLIDNGVSNSLNVYYATAGFGASNDATAKNATAKKELYLDLDCDEKDPKKHPSKVAAANALKVFVKTLNLPIPTIIDSGNGLHVHWFFNEAVPVHEWVAVAHGLKHQCEEHGLLTDTGCTADIVRILRIPGTVNTRGGGQVKLLTPIRKYDFNDLKSLIGTNGTDVSAVLDAARKLTKNSGIDTKTFNIDVNLTHKFEDILNKSLGDKGCAAIKKAYQERDTLSEPEWRAALSIAQYCEDRDWAIHEISKDYPNYDADQTEAKASATAGPYTCESMRSVYGDKVCTGCVYREKVKSPISIGKSIKEAEDNKIVYEDITYEVPEYPFPFFRGKAGGIYTRDKSVLSSDGDDDGEKSDDEKDGKIESIQTCVYPWDLYAFKRAYDPEIGDVVWFRIHLPHGDIREFHVAQGDIASKDKLRDAIAKHGATVFNPKKVLQFQNFVASLLINLQKTERVGIMRIRFGWTIDETFIIGEREYTPIGVKKIQVSKQVEQIAQYMIAKGSLDVWKRIANTYNVPKYLPQAIGLFASFGSMLMHLSPEKGGVINYYSKKSGTGKTTILKMANSVWGHPVGLMKYGRDTYLSKVHRMGTMNGLPICFDEMTNINPEQASDMLYGSTEGRARDRMLSNANMERINSTTWELISLWSSNTNMENKLAIIKADPQGELARIIEIPIQEDTENNTLYMQQIFSQLLDNYGTAGDIFARYVAANIDEVTTVMGSVRDEFYARREWSATDRYKINTAVCIITAVKICIALDLLHFDIKAIADYLDSLIYRDASIVKQRATTAVDTLAAYINKNLTNMLIIRDAPTPPSTSVSPMMTPKGSLSIRFEPDTDILYLVQRDFDQWCAASQINAKEIPDMFAKETAGTMVSAKKRMGKGTDSGLGTSNVYKIAQASKKLGIELE